MYKTQRNLMSTPENQIRMKIVDLLILLYHIEQGAQDQHVGFEDAEMTLDEMRKSLEHDVSLSIDLTQRALWSANLMDEQRKFWHPYGLTFNQFLQRILVGTGLKFDKTYNLLLDKYELEKDNK